MALEQCTDVEPGREVGARRRTLLVRWVRKTGKAARTDGVKTWALVLQSQVSSARYTLFDRGPAPPVTPRPRATNTGNRGGGLVREYCASVAVEGGSAPRVMDASTREPPPACSLSLSRTEKGRCVGGKCRHSTTLSAR